jgi:hypothetical protein
MDHMRQLLATLAAVCAIGAGLASVEAAPPLRDCDPDGTVVPGHCSDTIPTTPVTGHYTSLYQEDADGDWYWDLGDGRIFQSGVLDTEPIVSCDYQVQYRGNFGGTPFLDDGWIINAIRCDDGTAFQYLIVHASDPRYTGNPDWAIWGTWEYHTLVVSGAGNLVRPITPAP